MTIGFRSSASACRLPNPLTEQDKAKADVVFVGSPIAYFSKEIMLSGKAWRAVVDVEFSIEEVISGEIDLKNVKVRYPNLNSPTPEGLEEIIEWYGRKMKIGIVMPETFLKDCEFPESTNDSNERIYCLGSFAVEPYHETSVELPRIMGKHCGNLYIEPID